ncbi:MAG TPA: ATP synthase F1 subunit gamma [Candidatus Amulumruptor caecigallinarius]|uniref:ATP synthase gamma chain n=1 Tax=Candidatus Amulumruptor caecigallinarius TaxID=2109911 RepID=A0A921JJ38_9BACT|nr:ATP synthase F1 subunit gamma [Candidatus Amulumruptor caecigallinarius]
MATLRELKGRIGSVASSEKITGAMKMISSAKMHKAEQALRRLQPFRGQVETIIANLLSTDAQFASPLLERRDIKHLGIVVLGSDDGLCGAYNVNIFKQLLQHLRIYRRKWGDSIDITVYPVGEKIAKAVSKIGDSHIRVVRREGLDSRTSGDGVNCFLDHLKDEFLRGILDCVVLHYMNFKSVSRQIFTDYQLLPILQDSFASKGKAKATNRPCLFEPDAASIFSAVLPMYLMAVLQDVFTENRASEQASRVMAMQSANDNAKKLLDELQLEYNKLRQQAITSELLDILGGQAR